MPQVNVACHHRKLTERFAAAELRCRFDEARRSCGCSAFLPRELWQKYFPAVIEGDKSSLTNCGRNPAYDDGRSWWTLPFGRAPCDDQCLMTIASVSRVGSPIGEGNIRNVRNPTAHERILWAYEQESRGPSYR